MKSEATRTGRRLAFASATVLLVLASPMSTVGRAVHAAGFVVSNTSNAGPGSLRDAVLSANAVAGQDTITFNLPNPSTITLSNNLTITDDLRIEGPGRGALTLTHPASRVIDVNAGSLYIDSLTIDDAGSNAIIFGSPGETVVLDDVTISDSGNHALNVTAAASVTVKSSGVTNAKMPTLKGDGVHAENVTGPILIEDVVASGNEDNFEFANIDGTVTLRRVTVTSAVDEAADFQNVGGLVIQSSRFDANADQIDVNGVTGSVSVVDTTVTSTEIDDGVEISDVTGTTSVTSSTISGGAGAALDVSGVVTPTRVLILNSTLSGNAQSGILARQGSSVTVGHSTITGNGHYALNVLGGSVAVDHTIVTGNVQSDVRVQSGSATVRHSLVSAGSPYPDNVETIDAALGPLTDNGGPTQTHLPQPGSPAIGTGDPNVASPPAVDQRGSARVVATIDIGSVETPASTPPLNRGTVSILPAAVTVNESVGTVPFSVTRSGGSTGAVTVRISAQNLSAASPGDYAPLSELVTFGNGESGSKIVNLTIVDDAEDELSESLRVRLSEPTGGLAIGIASATVTISDNDDATPPPIDPELDAAGRFFELPPKRLFDTRSDQPAPGPKGKLGTGQRIDVQITSRAGVPANATAVMMNVTATETESPGFITVWAAGSPRPTTSNLNYIAPNSTRSNLVTVPIGQGGKVSMYALTPTHLLADVAGYFVDTDEPVAAGRFVALTPFRIFDTRADRLAAGPKGLVARNSTIDVRVAGEGGLPSTGISAVVMNLTATEAVEPGFVTAYASGTELPTASVLNMDAAGASVANLVVLPLGSNGMVRLYTLNSTHLLGDVMGYFTGDSAPVTTDGLLVPLAPNRIFDSRPFEPASGPKGFVAADSSVNFVAAPVRSIPADAAAVLLNITATESSGPNFVTGWPAGLDRPRSSLLNLGTGDTRPNATILAPGADQEISLYTLAGAHLIADSFGYFLG